MTATIGRYRKAVAAFCSGTLAWGGAVVASPPAHVTASEWLALAGVAFTTLVVAFVAPNDPPA